MPQIEALTARVRAEVEARLADDHDKRIKSAVRQAEVRARDALTLEFKDLHAQLAEQQRKAEAAERQELLLRKKARELEEKQGNLDLELERRLELEYKNIEKRLREQIDGVQDLREHGIEPEEAEECFFHDFDYCKDERRFDDVYILDGRTDRGRRLRLVFQDKGDRLARIFTGWELKPGKRGKK